MTSERCRLAGGPITNLTKGEGAKQSVRYRVTQLGRGGGGRGAGRGRGGGAQEPIDLSKRVLLSAFGEWTKKFRLRGAHPFRNTLAAHLG